MNKRNTHTHTHAEPGVKVGVRSPADGDNLHYSLLRAARMRYKDSGCYAEPPTYSRQPAQDFSLIIDDLDGHMITHALILS